MRKKILRTLILVMLCMFACGVTASAASTVATIGNKKYSSIDKALKAVKNGQTIKLKKNLTGKHIIIKRNVRFTFDLNKHTIKTLNTGASGDPSKVQGAIWVKKGNVTVKNGKVANGCIKVEKGAQLTVSGGTYWQIANLGTATVRKGTITTNKYSAIVNEGKLTIVGGTIKGKGNGIYQNSGKGSVVIKGGTFKDFKDSNPLVWVGKGKVTISGGKFYATSSDGVYLGDGTAVIKGGTFNSASNGEPLISVGGNKGKLTISGGSFTAGKTNVLGIYNGTVAITGSTFKSGGGMPTMGIAKGSLTIKKGNFHVENSNALVQQGGTVNITGGSYVASGDRCDFYPPIYISAGKLTVKENSSDMFKWFNGTVQNENGDVTVNGEVVAKGYWR